MFPTTFLHVAGKTILRKATAISVPKVSISRWVVPRALQPCRHRCAHLLAFFPCQLNQHCRSEHLNAHPYRHPYCQGQPQGLGYHLWHDDESGSAEKWKRDGAEESRRV